MDNNLDKLLKKIDAINVNEGVGSDEHQAYGPIETLRYLETYLQKHGTNLSMGDVDELRQRIRYALELAGVLDGNNDG